MAKSNCEFKGSGGQYFGTVFIHLFLLGIITFGIYSAWAWVRLLKLKASHTLIDGKEVSFQGTGGELFGLVLIQGFLTFLTFGLYGPWALCRYFDWRAENTVVKEIPSQFTGTGGSLFLLYLVHLILLPIVTLGLYYFWGLYRLYAWKEEHTKYGGEETSFGAGFGEFIKVGVISWILNTLTLNIFTPWSLCMLYRWQIEGLAVGDPDKVDHFPPVKTNPAVVIILVVIGLFLLTLAVFLAKKAIETTMQQTRQLAQFQQLQAQALQKKKRLKITEEETAKPLFLKPKDGTSGGTENTGALGRLKRNVNDFAGARKQVQARIKKSPGNAEAHYDLAWLYGSRLELAEAAGEYSKAIQMNNRFADAYYNRGLVYAAMGEFTKAIEDFSSTIKLNPAAADGYCNRGNAYFSMNKVDLAILDYTKSIGLNPGDGDMYYNRGRAFAAAGKKAKAVVDLRKAVSLGNVEAADYLKTLS